MSSQVENYAVNPPTPKACLRVFPTSPKVPPYFPAPLPPVLRAKPDQECRMKRRKNAIWGV